MAERPTPDLMKKNSFIKTGEPILTSYDFEDLVDGANYLRLYACRVYNNGDYYLISEKRIDPFIFYNTDAYKGATASVGVGVDFTQVLSLTFNTPIFNFPRMANGTARIQLPAYLGLNDSGSIRVTLTLSNATTSEVLATDTWTNTSASGPLVFDTRNYQRFITISNKWIAQGQQIRLNVLIDAKRTAAAVTATGQVAFDPINRSIGTPAFTPSADVLSTQLIVEIPFKVVI
jgi:hypothetical protein